MIVRRVSPVTKVDGSWVLVFATSTDIAVVETQVSLWLPGCSGRQGLNAGGEQVVEDMPVSRPIGKQGER